ncbi:MAG: acyl-[Lachnospiraceae bacterium]|nr:acyl-[acyl-carrier-protein] thioesterase [Lachnospiraceae bacterium]MBR4993957.1 acyl-[acyl-carrier-protein] thioesterase [Lachnospiraceae bacterium]
MAYEFKSRIRYSETDSNGYLSLEALMNYFQDASTFQSEELGVGLEPLYKLGLAWVVASWQIEIERFPKLLEEVSTGTFPHKFHSFLGERNFYMKDAEGNMIAKANSLWTLVNLKEMKPTPAPKGMMDKYVIEPKLPMNAPTGKIRLPEGEGVEVIEADNLIVRAYHLDTNNHVNNVQYIRMGMGCVPRDLNYKVVRVEYRKPAFLNSVIVPVVRKKDNVYTVSLQDTEGDVFVNLEFTC